MLSPVGTIGVTGAMARIIVVHNKETLGALPTATSLFTYDDMCALRNQTLLPRFSIIRDGTHTMVVTATNAAVASAMGPRVMVHIKIWPNKVIDFTGNLATVAAQFKDDYCLGVASNLSSQCTMTVECQMVYSDA